MVPKGELKKVRSNSKISKISDPSDDGGRPLSLSMSTQGCGQLLKDVEGF